MLKPSEYMYNHKKYFLVFKDRHVTLFATDLSKIFKLVGPIRGSSVIGWPDSGELCDCTFAMI